MKIVNRSGPAACSREDISADTRKRAYHDCRDDVPRRNRAESAGPSILYYSGLSNLHSGGGRGDGSSFHGPSKTECTAVRPSAR